jgi:hypothetical protein
MKKRHGDAEYESLRVENRDEGYVGMELFQLRQEHRTFVASVVFWDATGQFAVRMTNEELPLVVLEDLIEEAKSLVA